MSTIPRFDPSALLRGTTGKAMPVAPVPGRAPTIPSTTAPAAPGAPEHALLTDLRDSEEGIAALGTATALQRRDEVERRRVIDVTDSEYWVAVCFESRAQKEEWLRAIGIYKDADKYIDGRVLAQKMGVNLRPDTGADRQVQVSKRWLKHVREEGE